jgi:hypothetical protein
LQSLFGRLKPAQKLTKQLAKISNKAAQNFAANSHTVSLLILSL